VDSFQKIGKKTRSKDYNATQHVLSQSIVSKITRKHHFLKQTSHLMKCNIKTLQKYSNRRDSLDIGCNDLNLKKSKYIDRHHKLQPLSDKGQDTLFTIIETYKKWRVTYIKLKESIYP
jgi:hypothetical protein